MTIRQKNGLWNYVDLLSLSTSVLEKADDNPSFWDADSDLCLRSLSTTTVDRIGFSFVSPAPVYQFIEIDLIALGTNVSIDVIAMTDSQTAFGLRGEKSIAAVYATYGTLRTYRLPFVGAIEAFVFAGFKKDTPVNIKEIRFYTTPPSIHLLKAPQTTIALEPNTAYLVADNVSLSADVDGRYNVTVPGYAEVVLLAVFTMDGIDVSHGLIRVSVSQAKKVDLLFDLIDQPDIGLLPNTAIQVNAGYFEVFVTTEFKIVQITATNTASIEEVELCIELDNFKAVQSTNAFGVFEGRVISPLNDSLRVL